MFETLESLGSNSTKYSFDKPNPDLLERFSNPLKQTWMDGGNWSGRIEIACPEFTSLCPKTGQPDFATIKISYQPDNWCVESKALKLYLIGFRNHGEFHEACVTRIADDLVKLLEPHTLTVTGEFTPRGGIPFWPTVTYTK